MYICMTFFFFFSSRRRHTRFDCDWSSDVCSSDLHPKRQTMSPKRSAGTAYAYQRSSSRLGWRSEERRVGKECRSRWSADDFKKKLEVSGRALQQVRHDGEHLRAKPFARAT